MTDTWKDKEITPATIEKFLRTHGKRGVKTLSLLGRTHDIFEFAASEVGIDLLRDTMGQMEMLLNKIIDCTAKEEEIIEYRVQRNFYVNLTDKIALHLKLRKKLTD